MGEFMPKRRSQETVKQCVICGKTFTCYAKKAKYCDECKIVVRKEQHRKWKEAQRKTEHSSERLPGDIGTAIDTPEMIAICLNCTKPPNKCHGNCEHLLAARKKKIEDEVILGMLNEGQTVAEIAKYFNCRDNTIKKHMSDMKKKGVIKP